MEKQLTDAQIARARELRAAGWAYADIRSTIGADVAHDTIRAHCADVAVEGVVRKRVAKGVSTGKDGRTIRPFTAEDDAAIIAWCRDEGAAGGEAAGCSMAQLARNLDRKRHSVAARIRTLKKHGTLAG